LLVELHPVIAAAVRTAAQPITPIIFALLIFPSRPISPVWSAFAELFRLVLSVKRCLSPAG
jgi:hypothetical protein